jgi:lysozyme
LIQGFEGLSLTAYPDAAGYSIGYGHFGANKGDTITRAEAERFFLQDILKFETAVAFSAPKATQDQFDAMVSLAYNIGTAGFTKSSVLRYHNMGDYSSAADAFNLFNKSQGKVLPVLVARRAKERDVYLNGHGAYKDLSISTQPVPTPDPKKGGILQFVIGLCGSAGLLYGIYTRTNFLQGKLAFRKKPRELPSLSPDTKARFGL